MNLLSNIERIFDGIVKKSNFIIIIVATLFLFHKFEIMSQEKVQVGWVKHYFGPDSLSEPSRLTLDKIGNVYVTGWTYNAATNWDFATIKYNSTGKEQWAVRYNRLANFGDLANAIAIDDSGNVYIAGSSGRVEVSYPDYTIVKYTSNGIKAWDVHYNGPSNLIDVAVAMVSDKNGNVYVTGYSYEPRVNYLTIKYNADGVLQWVARYDGQGTLTNVPAAMTIDNWGNLYVTGYSGSSDSGSKRDCVTIKYNSQGIQQWVARYNGAVNGHDIPSDLTSDSNGNVYITGSSDSPTGADYITIKYNTEGVRQWIAHYNGPGDIYNAANAIAIDDSGNIYITGISFGRETSADYATIMYNAFGVEQWVARYDGTGNGEDSAVDVALDSTGNVYVTGRSAASRAHPFNHDYATIKYSSTGIEQWVIRYNGFANSEDDAKALAVDEIGNVYVTGRSVINEKHSIYTTLKYAQTPQVSVKEKVAPVARIGQLLPNYPNPFNSSTKFKYVVSRNCHVTLKLFDLTGQEITTIVDGQQIAGEHAINWDAGNLPSGIYTYHLKTEGFFETRKLILIK